MVEGIDALAERLHGSRPEDLFRAALIVPVLQSRSAQPFDCRLDRVALYAIHVFGTFPPLAASWRMTSLWSQTFIFDEPFVSPE